MRETACRKSETDAIQDVREPRSTDDLPEQLIVVVQVRPPAPA